MKSKYKANLWKIYVFRFLVALNFIGGILVPFFTDWGGITFTQIMILQAWFIFWTFLLEVPTGTIADFFGRKISIIISSLISILGVLVFIIAPNFYIFLLAEFLLAIGMALLTGADDAFVYDSLKKIKKEKESKKVFSRLESFGLAGIMVGAPIGSIIASLWGLRLPMLLSVIPTIFAFFIALTLKEPTNTQGSESKRYAKIFFEGIKYFYKNRVLKILALDMVVITSIGYFLIWLYQPMLMKAGLDIYYFGLIHAGLVAAQIILINLYGKMEKLLRSKKRLIFVSGFVAGVALIIGGLTSYLPVVIIVILIGGGFSLSRRPIFVSYFNKQIPTSKRATVLSSISMFRKFILMILYPVVGLMVDWSLSATLIALGIIAVSFSFISRVEEKHLVD